jgi:hypothetical protein
VRKGKFKCFVYGEVTDRRTEVIRSMNGELNSYGSCTDLLLYDGRRPAREGRDWEGHNSWGGIQRAPTSIVRAE